MPRRNANAGSQDGPDRAARARLRERMAQFTPAQLRAIAGSADPAHAAVGFAAECELIFRAVQPARV